MSRDAVNVSCPHCGELNRFRRPTADPLPERAPAWLTPFGGREVRCRSCAWEFEIDLDGEVIDDGEAEATADLELNADGEWTVADARDGLFPPYHGAASLALETARRRGWRDFADEPEPIPDEEYEWSPEWRRVRDAFCPNCCHRFPLLFLGEVHCPDCDWAFHLDFDEVEYDDYEDYEDEFVDSGGPTAPDARALRPLVVSPRGDSDFTSIAEALQRAEPGRRIDVHPGYYEESLEIQNAVELRGVGGPGAVTVVSRAGPCVAVRHDRAVVQGLSLRYLGTGETHETNESAVLLEAGLVHDCDATSRSAQCVEVRGGELRRCRVHDGEGSGVLLFGGAVVDCDLFHNVGPNLSAADGLARGCRIHHGHAAGVRVLPQGRPCLVECDVHGHAGPGVTVEGDRALLWRCRVHHNGGPGVFVPARGIASLERSAVFANAGPGLKVRGGTVYAWRSRFFDGASIGASVRGDGVVDLRRCAAYRNARAGVRCDKKSRPHLHRCHLVQNFTAGRPRACQVSSNGW